MTGSSPLLVAIVVLLMVELAHLRRLWLRHWRCGGCGEPPRSCGCRARTVALQRELRASAGDTDRLERLLARELDTLRRAGAGRLRVRRRRLELTVALQRAYEPRSVPPELLERLAAI